MNEIFAANDGAIHRNMRETRAYSRVNERDDDTSPSDSCGMQTAHIGHGITKEISVWVDCSDPLNVCSAGRG